ncbi:hypothetical protein GH714_030564 [Hevea brasiliensis]|uniref:Uncharacterized protein n=1 Tax=Hevea brasiliensis TaxID=3981 RepID=A0A6A6LG81_HEVBR|nr:hypothetical protein GH714_030564 [Hevea brasiliensis]
MTRRCSHCSHNGHNSRTCPNRGVKLFGVRLTDGSIRKSASMGNLSHYTGSPNPAGAHASGSNNPGSPGGDTPDHGGAADGYASEDFVPGSSSSRERKKGVPWTEEEHRMFLFGLQKLGKGDWRGIARSYVISRTPTQPVDTPMASQDFLTVNDARLKHIPIILILYLLLLLWKKNVNQWIPPTPMREKLFLQSQIAHSPSTQLYTQLIFHHSSHFHFRFGQDMVQSQVQRRHMRQCGSILIRVNGNIDKCLYAIDEDCRTTGWTYKNGVEDGVLDQFQPDEQLKKKKNISYVRRHRDVYKTLGPGSESKSATVLAFRSLFTIDIHKVQRDQRIQSLIEKSKFLSFVPEILRSGEILL